MSKKPVSTVLDNLKLFDLCLTRQELLADPHFSAMNPFIITESRTIT